MTEVFPWNSEPDEESWTDTVTGLPCFAERCTFGAWLGYVGVAAGHALFGIDIKKAAAIFHPHGGITMIGLRQDKQPSGVWWFGFSCDHYGDMAPLADYMPGKSPEDMPVYRTLSFVRQQCAELSSQIVSIGHQPQGHT